MQLAYTAVSTISYKPTLHVQFVQMSTAIVKFVVILLWDACSVKWGTTCQWEPAYPATTICLRDARDAGAITRVFCA